VHALSVEAQREGSPPQTKRKSSEAAAGHMPGPNWPSRRYELVVKKGTAPLGLKLHQTKSRRGEEWSMAAMVCGKAPVVRVCVCG